MAWTQLDDNTVDRLWNLSDGAWRLHISGLVLSNRLLLDGRIPGNRVAGLVPRFRRAVLDELVRGGHWRPVDDDWQIVTGLSDQLTKEQVLARRRASRERVKRFRGDMSESRASYGIGNGVTSSVGNTRPGPTRPVPARPKKTGVNHVDESNSTEDRLPVPDLALQAFSEAWDKRGLDPLTHMQRETLKQIVAERPMRPVQWLSELPAESGVAETFAHVVARFEQDAEARAKQRRGQSRRNDGPEALGKIMSEGLT